MNFIVLVHSSPKIYKLKKDPTYLSTAFYIRLMIKQHAFLSHNLPTDELKMGHTHFSDVFCNLWPKKITILRETNMVKAEDLWNIMTAEAANSTIPGYQLLPNSLTLESVVNEWLFIYDFPIVKVVRNYETGEVSFVQFLDLQVTYNFVIEPLHQHKKKNRNNSTVNCRKIYK